MEYYLPTKGVNFGYCYNIDEPWKHYAEQKKLDTKGRLLYDSINMRVQNREIYREGK